MTGEGEWLDSDEGAFILPILPDALNVIHGIIDDEAVMINLW